MYDAVDSKSYKYLEIYRDFCFLTVSMSIWDNLESSLRIRQREQYLISL